MRRFLLFLSAFIGIGAYLGGLMMFVDPSGVIWSMDPMLPLMRAGLPFLGYFFDNFVWSGVALCLVNGVSNTVGFVALLKNRKYAYKWQLISGLLLLIWLGVQWLIFEVNVMTMLYTVLALGQIFLSLFRCRPIA